MTDPTQTSIRLTILGRSYSVKVQKGDEPMMEEAAQFINDRYDQYRRELAGQPDYTINAMALLSIAVDLFQEKNVHEEDQEELDTVKQDLNKLLEAIKE